MSETLPTIRTLLNSRGARFKAPGGDRERARTRASLTRSIEQNYSAFEPLRDHLLKRTSSSVGSLDELAADARIIVDELHAHDLVHWRKGRPARVARAAKRFLSGGWLEELAWLAAVEAGVDEAVFSQELSWRVGEYAGENEIDLIMRRGDCLGFVSCKALQSEYDSDNRKHRRRLMDALHEADNLVDHFGVPGEHVGILVTTDLYDEVRGQARYNALMGKAAVLDVRIIALEELGWSTLVDAIGEILP